MNPPPKALRALVFALPLLVACGGQREPVVPLGAHFDADGDPTWGAWAGFAPGARVTVVAMEGCPELVATSPASTSGEPLRAASWPYSSPGYTVVESSVLSGQQGHLALTLRGDAGEEGTILVPVGKEPICVTASRSDGRPSIASFLGKPLRFRPSRRACTLIEAAGSALSTALLSEEPDPLVFSTLTVGPAHAGPSGGSSVPWAKARDADLSVRADLLDTCFVAETGGPTVNTGDDDEARRLSARALASPAANATSTAPRLLHIDPRRCKRSPDPRGEHLECATPVGMWEGYRAGDALSLHLIRRTVGSLHFVAGRPVDGRGFARTVVAVRTGTTGDPSVERLYASMRAATSSALSADDGIRVVTSDADRPNLSIGIEATDVRVSDVATRSKTLAHEYEDGTRTEPNPEKRAAQRKVAATREAIATAKDDCDDKKRTAKQTYENCIAATKAVANTANGDTEKALSATGEAGCAILRAATNDSCPEIARAQERYRQAQDDEGSTSATIEVPIKKQATYTKTYFSRSVTAQVTMTATLDGTEQPVVRSPFSAQLEDFEIEANPEIKLAGHRRSAPWIEEPRTAIPAIAAPMAAWVGARVRGVLATAALERARRALRVGGEEVKPGFEAVGGLAVEVADTRLRGVLKTGTASLDAGKSVALPRASGLTRSECLLVVAMLPEGSVGKLQLATADATIADLRGKPYATIEICRSDMADPSQELPIVQVATEATSGSVLWAEYRTSAFTGGQGAENDGGGTPNPPPASVERAPMIAAGVRPAPLEGLMAYARGAASTWVAGSAGNASLGDVFTSGPSVALGAGVRVGSGWLAYGEWERGFVGVGTRSPIFNFSKVSSQSDTFLVGGRKTFSGWLVQAPGVGRMYVSPFVDLGLGYSVLRQEGTDVAGDSRILRLPSGALRLMTGVSLRPSRFFSVDPVIGGLLGWVNQIEAEQTIGGTTRASAGQFDKGSLRASLFFGLTGVVDAPFGDGSPAAPPAKQSARNEARR